MAERPIRVLWLAKGLGPGGMERLLVNHASFGDHQRFDYQAAYLVERPNAVTGELESAGVRCHLLGSGRTFDPRWVSRLRSLIVRERIDVVHAHSPLPASVMRLIARSIRPRPRLAYTEHNSWDCYGAPTRVANALTYRFDDAQLAVSADAVASIPKRMRRRVTVLTHGIDLDGVRAHRRTRAESRAELGVDDDAVVVISVANLRAEKGHEVLFEATARLAGTSGVVVLAVGHGQLEDELRDLRRRLGLGDRLRMLGFRPDAANLMAGSDVFVLSSHQEGLPVALMEAMALGLPVVSTRVGGVPDYVTDGVNGRLVPPGRPDLLADAIGELAGDEALRRRFGEAGERLASAFDARVAAARLDDLYSELVA